MSRLKMGKGINHRCCYIGYGIYRDDFIEGISDINNCYIFSEL